MKKTSTAALLAALTLASCAPLQTDWTAPALAGLPVSYANAPPAGAAVPVADAWWESFGDDRLNGLVERVLAANNDLAAAAIVVRQAQIQACLAADNALPHASAQASADEDSDGARSYSASGAVSYEVDLFGKLGAERDAARWEARATAEDLEAARLTLIGTTLDLYWRLAELNERIALAEAGIAYADQIQDLVNVQYGAGAVSAIELNEAVQSREGQRAGLASLVQSRAETRTALALLLGQTDWSAAEEPARLPDDALPQVAPGAPAELLGRRPDLRAAERRLRGTLADVDVARASFYPGITLTGSAGGASTDLAEVLSNPVAALGVGIDLPFLDWNRLSLQLRLSQAEYERAVILFRQTLLAAFGEVEDALSARAQLEQREQSLEAALDAARRVEQLYGVRYRQGAVSLRIYLDAQQQTRTAEETLAANRLARLQAQATFYQAIGGGLA